MIKPRNPDDYNDFYNLEWLAREISAAVIYENMLGWELEEVRESEKTREMRKEGGVEKIVMSFQ